jgi:integrase
MIRSNESGDVVIDGHASTRGLIELWERTELAGRRDIAPGTRTRFEAQARVLIEHLGDTRLRTLGADRIEAMYAQLVRGSNGRRPWGHASLVSLRSTLGQILRFGVRRRIIPPDRNIASATVIPADAAGEKERSALTVEQAHGLWDAAPGHVLGAMWRVALLTGLRPGELAGLVWSSVDIDGAHPSVTISRAVRVERGTARLVDSVKTKGSYRTIALPPQLVPVLREHRAAQNVARIAASTWENADLVFCTGRGTPLNPSNVRRDLLKFCNEHGVPAISSNELRHTAASMMLDAGMTLEQVASVLGHKSTRMLERHYRHNLRPRVDVHVAAMTTVFAGMQ